MSENTTEAVPTRIPELSNILLIGSEEFYINAKKAEEASKVSEKLLINCVGLQNVTQIGYNGEKQKSISIVPASGGTYKGPLFAESGINSNITPDEIASNNAVIVAKDFKTLYEKYHKNCETKTPYEIAKENGFEGTEVEFNELLGNISNTNGTINLNIENGSADNSLQQKLVDESWTIDNGSVNSDLIKELINNETANEKYTLSAAGIVVNEDDGTITVPIGAVGSNSTMLNGKSLTYGDKSHAEGTKNIALENGTHAEGNSNLAWEAFAHAEGSGTTALGNSSHTEGKGTVATRDSSHVEGEYNLIDTDKKYLHILGNGHDANNRSNAHTIDKDGNAWFAGNITIGTKNERLATENYVNNHVKLPIVKTDDNTITYANFYTGPQEPTSEAPIGSIWIKTEL